MAAAMMVPMSMSCKHTVGARPAATRRSFAPRPAPGMTRRQRLQPIYAEEKSQLDKIADVVEDKAQDLVKKTQENSGLGPKELGTQPQKGDVFNKKDAKLGAADVTETFSFTGLLPEIINGRAAMFAMLAVFGAELNKGTPLFIQIQQAPKAIVATFLIIIAASVIPVVRGADLNINGAGPFTQRAEVWNGRTAMVAFALLIAVETWKGGPGLVFW